MFKISRVGISVGIAAIVVGSLSATVGNADVAEKKAATDLAPNGKVQKRFGPDSASTKKSKLFAAAKGTAGGVRAAGAKTQIRVPNNAGCKGKADYAHRSGNYASVHGRTKCKIAVQRLWVGTSLTRHRWWGEQTIDSDTSSRTWRKSSKDATPHAWCLGEGTYTYTGWSDHTAKIAGKTYIAGTRGKSKEFTC